MGLCDVYLPLVPGHIGLELAEQHEVHVRTIYILLPPPYFTDAYYQLCRFRSLGFVPQPLGSQQIAGSIEKHPQAFRWSVHVLL